MVFTREEIFAVAASDGTSASMAFALRLLAVKKQTPPAPASLVRP